MPSTYELLIDHARETALLVSVQNLLGWDERTMLPEDAGPYRAEQMAYLAGVIHERQASAQFGDWLAELVESPLAKDPYSDSGTTIRWLKRDYDRKVKLPSSLVKELARTSVLGQQAWAEAKQNSDFASFAPLLEKTFHLKRQEAEAIGYAGTPYDALLDEYEPFEQTSTVHHLLASLQRELVPLIESVQASGRRPRAGIVNRHYSLDAQESFGRSVAARIGFDFRRGRVDTTAHPFCTRSGPHDVRITTRYEEWNFSRSLFSILHEAGHGIYEQGLKADAFGMPLGEAVSLGIHESQSRMWENLVGRSKAFWKFFFPEAQRLFADSLRDVAFDDFYFAINQVQPSLNRVEADEATYNLHIVIRFELEQALLAGDLPVAELPGAWKERYRATLGVTPHTDAEGVLQDIHWAAGLVGYFPTYALGNLYAAQFYEQVRNELDGLESLLERGHFESLREWLRTRIHSLGQRFPAAELVRRVTGAPLSHASLMTHLRAKLVPLYGIR